MVPFLTRIACEHFAFGLLIPVYIVLLIEQLGLSLTQAGLAVSCTAAASFILEVPAGALADKIERKYLLVGSSALHLLAYLSLFFAESIYLVLLGAAFTGAAFALASGTEESYVHDTFEVDKNTSFEKQLSKVSITDEVATIAGMLSSSFILINSNYSTLLGMAVFLLLCATLAAMFLIESKKTTVLIGEEVTIIKTNFNFKRSAVLMAIFLLLAVLAESGRLLWQPQLLATGWSVAQLGYVFAVIKLGSIAGAYIAGATKVKNINAILLGGIIGAVGLLVFSQGLFAVSLVGLGAYLLAENFIRIHTTSFILSLPNVQRQKATILSIYSIVNNSYLSVSGVLLGIVATSSLSGALITVTIVKLLATLGLVVMTFVVSRRSGRSFFG